MAQFSCSFSGEAIDLADDIPELFEDLSSSLDRIAGAVRLNGAFDVQNARARLRDGELTIALPKLEERRGRGHRIPIR